MTSPALGTRLVLSTAAAIMAVLVLAGCTSSTPVTPPSNASTAAADSDAGADSAGQESAPPAADPVFVADGTAEDNLPLFTKIVNDQWAAGSGTTGKSYTDALVAAGFDVTAMEVTASKTTLGNDVESLQFAVLWHGSCLVGQVGPSTGDPIATVLPELKDGGCFVATTAEVGS